MSVDELRIRIRRSLEEKLGVDEATYLMDRPPGGWSDLVTWSVLDARLDALEARMDAKLSGLDAKIAKLDAKLDAKIAKLEARIDGSEERMSALEARILGQIERRFRVQTAYLVVALGVLAGVLKI